MAENLSYKIWSSLGLLITFPIWAYLIYWVIKNSNPDRFIWFLFWIYLPTHFLFAIVGHWIKKGETANKERWNMMI